jgi:hypothetical protein
MHAPNGLVEACDWKNSVEEPEWTDENEVQKGGTT